MSAPYKSVVISISVIFLYSTVFAADRPDSGSLLRENNPPPAVKPLPQRSKIEPKPQKEKSEPSGVRVKVSGFTFTGNTLFSDTELSALMSGYLSTELTFDELNAAATVITKSYRAKGYFLVMSPYH